MQVVLNILRDWKIYLLLTFVLAAVIAGQTPDINQPVDIRDTDALEYQTVAVNLIQFHKYPYEGFVGDINVYQIDTAADFGLSNYLRFKVLKETGSILDVSKPPFYTLLLASLYKIFGLHTSVYRVLNIFLLSFITVFQLYLAVRLLGLWGLLVGLFSACVYFQSAYHYVYFIYPNYVVSFFVLLICLALHHFKDKQSVKPALLIGGLTAFMVLTNGNTIFIPVLYFGYLFLQWMRNRRIDNHAFSIVAFLAVILPWIIFANIRLHNTKPERDVLKEKLLSDAGSFTVDKTPFLSKPLYTSSDTMLMTLFIKRMYSKYVEDGFVLLSKQPFGDEILGCHNEFCPDGRFHPEWRFMSKSYYYNCRPGQSTAGKIFSFYIANPEYLHKNMVGKFKGTTSPTSIIYYLCILILGLLAITAYVGIKLRWALTILVISSYFLIPFGYAVYLVLLMFLVYNLNFFFGRNTEEIPWILPLAITNVTLITIIFIGEVRYVQIIEPIAIVGVFYLANILRTRLVPVRS